MDDFYGDLKSGFVMGKINDWQMFPLRVRLQIRFGL